MKQIFTFLAAVLLTASTYAQVGIGTTTPAGALDIVSTTSGIVLPRVANTSVVVNPNGGAIENGTMVYDLSANCVKFYANGAWTGCIQFAANNIGKDTTTTLVELMSSTGRTWMDRNLGATQVAASSTDAASYGDQYQWGRAKDGHESRTSNTTATTATSAAAGHGDFITATSGTDYNWTDFVNEDTLWQSGLNDPCPTGYRIPTETEFDAERLAFSSNDAAGAFSALKLPFAGLPSAVMVRFTMLARMATIGQVP
jgi:hypothetical protein